MVWAAFGGVHRGEGRGKEVGTVPRVGTAVVKQQAGREGNVQFNWRGAVLVY